jgi:hypothetical protein
MGVDDVESSSLLMLLTNYPALPGTSDFVRPIPTEECGVCEFASSIKNDEGPRWWVFIAFDAVGDVPQAPYASCKLAENAFAWGHCRRFRPIAERRVWTVLACKPGIATTSTPGN